LAFFNRRATVFEGVALVGAFIVLGSLTFYA